jgi:hypothetical protein
MTFWRIAIAFAGAVLAVVCGAGAAHAAPAPVLAASNQPGVQCC